jgi:hypothetical protein
MNQVRDLVPPALDCPQCGAPVRLRHDARTALCASCRSTLVVSDGVLVHVLREQVGVTPEQAGGILASWLSRQSYLVTTPPALGTLRFFPFLRVKGDLCERVEPLRALPSPAVGHLAQSPAKLVETDAVDEVDPAVLHEAIETACDEDGVRRVQVELRAYYPARYVPDRQGSAYTLVIDAGQGGVYPDGLPPRGDPPASHSKKALIGLGAVLIVEAVAVPGMVASLVAIVATVMLFLVVLFRWRTELG